jgi:hypothetical protein
VVLHRQDIQKLIQQTRGTGIFLGVTRLLRQYDVTYVVDLIAYCFIMPTGKTPFSPNLSGQHVQRR